MCVFAETGLVHAFSVITTKEKGIRSLYKGFLPTTALVCVTHSANANSIVKQGVVSLNSKHSRVAVNVLPLSELLINGKVNARCVAH